MTPKELRDAGWIQRRETSKVAPRTIWTRGNVEIAMMPLHPKAWEFQMKRAGELVISDSTWGVAMIDYMRRLGRDIAVYAVDGATTFQKLQRDVPASIVGGEPVYQKVRRYEEFPKDAVPLRQWALTPATP